MARAIASAITASDRVAIAAPVAISWAVGLRQGAKILRGLHAFRLLRDPSGRALRQHAIYMLDVRCLPSMHFAVALAAPCASDRVAIAAPVAVVPHHGLQHQHDV